MKHSTPMLPSNYKNLESATIKPAVPNRPRNPWGWPGTNTTDSLVCPKRVRVSLFLGRNHPVNSTDPERVVKVGGRGRRRPSSSLRTQEKRGNNPVFTKCMSRGRTPSLGDQRQRTYGLQRVLPSLTVQASLFFGKTCSRRTTPSYG